MSLPYRDDILVKKLQEGETEAFDLLYEKYAGKLYVFSLKYLRSSIEAEEVVQTVFLKLWENRRNLNHELSFKAFLFTIAYNDTCYRFRKRNYLQKFISDSLSSFPTLTTELEQGMDYKSILDRISQIVEMLPERQRCIFRKSREEGKSTKEIASELKLAPGTVDNYISGTLKFIRQQFADGDLAFWFFAFLFML